jgi:hypothetical protein
MDKQELVKLTLWWEDKIHFNIVELFHVQFLIYFVKLKIVQTLQLQFEFHIFKFIMIKLQSASAWEDSIYGSELAIMENSNGKVSVHKNSSRSHCIFTIYLELRSKIDSSTGTIISKLHLVDLAESERVGKTRTQGPQLTEANYINKALTYLEQVNLTFFFFFFFFYCCYYCCSGFFFFFLFFFSLPPFFFFQSFLCAGDCGTGGPTARRHPIPPMQINECFKRLLGRRQ